MIPRPAALLFTKLAGLYLLVQVLPTLINLVGWIILWPFDEAAVHWLPTGLSMGAPS